MVVTASLPWWVWIFLIIIFSLQIYSLVRNDTLGDWSAGEGGSGRSLPSIDIEKLKGSVQRNILIIMVISTLFLGFSAYYFMGQEPNMERPYVILMLHASIFISTVSVWLGITNQMNAEVPPSA